MMKSMIMENGVTFKELEKNIYAWICEIGRQFTQEFLERYDRLLMESRDKKKYRNPILSEQVPDSLRMSLDPVCSADQKNPIIQHLHGPLHLGRKISMARRIYQIIGVLPSAVYRLFGKHSNSSLPLHLMAVHKAVPAVHPAQGTNQSAAKQHLFRKCSLSGIHMGQNPKCNFHDFGLSPPTVICLLSYHEKPDPYKHNRTPAGSFIPAQPGMTAIPKCADWPASRLKNTQNSRSIYSHK